MQHEAIFLHTHNSPAYQYERTNIVFAPDRCHCDRDLLSMIARLIVQFHRSMVHSMKKKDRKEKNDKKANDVKILHQ